MNTWRASQKYIKEYRGTDVYWFPLPGVNEGKQVCITLKTIKGLTANRVRRLLSPGKNSPLQDLLVMPKTKPLS